MVQFNTIENVIMTIYASHIDSLIVYEHFGRSEGGDLYSLGFSFKPR